MFLLFLLSWDSSHLRLEENQPSPHLLQGLCPALMLLAGLRGNQLLSYFYRYVALVCAHMLLLTLTLTLIPNPNPDPNP